VTKLNSFFHGRFDSVHIYKADGIISKKIAGYALPQNVSVSTGNLLSGEGIYECSVFVRDDKALEPLTVLLPSDDDIWVEFALVEVAAFLPENGGTLEIYVTEAQIQEFIPPEKRSLRGMNDTPISEGRPLYGTW